MIFQKFNKRSKRWVKFRKYSNGKCKILDVKQREPLKPFKDIPKK